MKGVDLQDVRLMEVKKSRAKESTDKNKKRDADLFLKKHVGLIHCENKLTLMQRKICNILLFNALDKINDQDIHEIPIRQLCSLVGYNSNDSKQIKVAIKSLIAVVMEWNLLDDSKFLDETDYPEDAITWNASSLLAGASIRNGIISYSYSPQMKSVLSSLDIYGRINLFVQAKFNSTYSLVLYENCVRFKNIKQTAWMSIDLFRSLMGVPAKKYPSFKEFKRSVINVAVDEINKKSDIYIEPQFKKAGRSISSVQFLLSENKKYQPSFKRDRVPDTGTNSTHLQQQSSLTEILLVEFNLSSKQVGEVVATYSQEYLLEKITLVKSKKNIEHAGAYLLAALKKDYKASSRVNPKAQPTVAINSSLREAKAATEISSLKNKYMSYKLATYTDFIKQQADSLQTMIKEKFEQVLMPKAEVYRLYKKSGLSSPFVTSDFMTFIETEFPSIIGEYLSFDDYISSDEY